MFDCVMPTRNARNGQLFTKEGPINIKNSKYFNDQSPIDVNSHQNYQLYIPNPTFTIYSKLKKSLAFVLQLNIIYLFIMI